MPSFPTQPTVGEIFTFGQYSWQWTGTYWQPYVSSSTSFTAITSVGNGYSIINNTTGTTLELRSFSGINITIITGTSGTLTFSASTGGGGGGGSGSSGTSGINGSSGTSGNSGSSGTSGTSPDISGTINYIPKFTGATSLGNSLIYDDGTKFYRFNTYSDTSSAPLGNTIKEAQKGAPIEQQKIKFKKLPKV